ncbi:MAG: N-acetyltransferase [Zavarzinella sp.]
MNHWNTTNELMVHRTRMVWYGKTSLPTTLPTGYLALPWCPELLEDHAMVLAAAFAETLDALLFPRLGSLQTTLGLMDNTISHPGFLPTTTWLITGPTGACAVVQGIKDSPDSGYIMNLAVCPDHQNRGLGRKCLELALNGFKQAGITRVTLEATTGNVAAMRLYESLGFTTLSTLYREIKDTPDPYCI